MKKTVFVVLLILLIEVLYIQVDPVSFGFPFRSVEYRAEDIVGAPLYWAGEELLFGFNVEPILLVCDILVAFLLALILIQCVPSFIIVSLFQGCILGFVISPVACWCAETISEPLLSIILIPLLFVLTPLIIYLLSLRNQRQNTAIITISFMTATTVCFAVFLIGALFDGVDEDIYNLRLIPRLLAFTAVPVIECFVLMLLHKKVLPLVLRKKRLKTSSDIIENNATPINASGTEKTNQKKTLKRAILYVSLLAITSYIGHHFMTVRKMKNDDLFVIEVIESKLERINIPNYKRLEEPVKGRMWSMQVIPESFESGWNASCRTEVKVDDEDFSAEIRKHFFIPWIQVEIQKKKNGTN